MSTPRITYHVTNWRGKITPPISAFCKAHSHTKSHNHQSPAVRETSRAGRAIHVYTPMTHRTSTLAALLLAAVALASCSKDDTPQDTRNPLSSSSSEEAATLQVTMQGDTTASRDVNVKFDIPSDDSPAL